MTPKFLPDEDAKALLTRALQDPFGFEPVSDWYDLLMRRFPLWAFQAWAYADLQESQLPTNYPLQPIMQSIFEDEGLKAGEGQFLEALPNTVDKRRYKLSEEGRYGRTVAVIERQSLYPTYEKPPLRGGNSLFNRVYPLPVPDDFNPEDPESYDRPEKEIGWKLVRLFEARGAIRLEDLKRFVKSLAVKLGRGNPGKGLKREVAKPLVEQGEQLLGLCWDMFPVNVSDHARQVLATAGVKASEEQELWAARLALPVLSRPEILALKAQSEKERAWKWTSGGGYPTPKQVTIWILARRLRMEPRPLARNTLSAQTAYKHFDGPNPIDAFRK